MTIFTPSINEEDDDANGLIGEPDFDLKADLKANSHSRDKLTEFITDYNALYQGIDEMKQGYQANKAFKNYDPNAVFPSKKLDLMGDLAFQPKYKF